jgi:alpha-tubulin suppressor-like RCC1 family protein
MHSYWFALRRCTAAMIVCATAACGGGSDPPPTVGGPEQTSEVVLAGPAGVQLTVPPGAVGEPVTLRVAANSSGAPALPPGQAMASTMVEVTPHGAVFSKPVRLRLPFDPGAIPAGIDPVVLKANPGGQWDLIEPIARSGNTVDIEVTTLSYFVITGRPLGNLSQSNAPRIAMSRLPAESNWNGPVVTLLQPSDVRIDFRLENAPPCATGWELTYEAGYHRWIDWPNGVRSGRTLGTAVSSTVRESGGVISVRVPFGALERVNNLTGFDYQEAGYVGTGVARDYLWLNMGQAILCRPDPANPGNFQFYPVAKPLSAAELYAATGTRRIGISAPADANVLASQSVSFAVDVYNTGAGPNDNRVRVEWMRAPAGSDVFQRLGSTFSLDSSGITHRVTLPAAVADNGARYRAVACLIDNSLGLNDCVESAPATLTVVATGAAPEITVPPRSLIVTAGETANLSVQARGTPAPSYRWQAQSTPTAAWTDVPGATTSSLTTEALSLSMTGRQYRVIVSNAAGSVTSQAVAVSVTTVPVAPTITVQPANTTVATGSDAVFAVAATGTEALSYQWFLDGSPFTGANSAVLRLPAVGIGDDGISLSVRVSNAAGQASSSAATLTVLPAGTGAPSIGPTIVTQPTSVAVNTGNTATFAVGVNGTTPMVFQWVKNGVPIPGATAAAYTLASVSAGDAGTYEVIVGNSAGATSSAAATLTVSTSTTPVAPSIGTQPVGLAVNPGQTATFAVAASGSGPLSYQWRRDGINLPGANGPVLTIGSAQAGDAGNYTLVVSNGTGSATSNAAGLVVVAAPGAPSITTQPANRSAVEGQPATFSLAVTGNPAPQCQWTRNSVAISGATSCTGYTTPATSNADNGAVYNAVVYSAGGVAIGNGAVLTVQPLLAPTIISQPPPNLPTTEGSNLGLSVAATSNGVLTYQWRRGGADIAGATAELYQIGTVSIGDNGAQFSVRVCTGPQANNLCTLSNTVTLTVSAAVPANALTATQIVAGQEWSLVLRPDRTVWGWGSVHRENGTVQYLNQTLPAALRPVRMYPAALTDVRAISGWFNSFWALKGEPGTTGSRVLHWGRAYAGTDGRGVDGNGGLSSSMNPSIPPRDNEAAPVEVLERVNNVPQPVDRVCAIAGGGEQLAMIRAINSSGTTTDCNAGSAKTVWFVGSLLGRGYESTGVAFAMPGLPTNSPPAVIFTGQTTSGSPGLAIALEDGRVYGLGANPYGGFGVAASGSGIVGDLSGPLLLPSTWGGPRSFGMSFYYSLFVVRADGSVMTSGYDLNGELGLGSVIGGSTLGPVAVKAESCTSLPCTDVLTGVTAIAGTQTGATLALKNGQILGWGARDSNGLRGPGVTANQPFPRAVPSTVTGFTALSASYAHALVIGPGNVVYAWGNGLRGTLGDGTDNTRTAPGMVTVP